MDHTKASEVAVVGHHERSEELGDDAPDRLYDVNLDERPHGWTSTFRKCMAMLSFQLGYLSGVWALVSIGNLLAIINKDIGPSLQYTWMANGFILASGILVPIVGRLGDIFGRRNFFLVADALAIVGCAVMARATSVSMFIAGAVLSGVALSMQQLAFAAVSELVPNKWRSFALGVLEMSLAPAAVFGAVCANAFAIHVTWRWAFWLVFIFNCLSFTLIFFFYHPAHHGIKHTGESRWTQVRQLDYIGAIMFVAGLTLFLVGLSFGGVSYPWHDAHVVAPLVVGAVLLIIFGFFEAYAPVPYPLFPPTIFREVRAFIFPNICVFLEGMCYYSGQVIWPEEVQTLFTTSGIKVGWYTAALSAGGCVFSPIIGYVNHRYGHSRWLLVASVVGLTFASGLGAVVTRHSEAGSTVAIVLVSITSAGIKTLTTAIVQLGVAHEYIGIATSMTILTISVGGSVGTTIYTAILQNYEGSHLVPSISKAALALGLPTTSLPALLKGLLTGNAAILAKVPGLTPQILGAAEVASQEVAVSAFKRVYLVSIAFGCIAIVAAWFTADLSEKMTDEVAVKIDHHSGVLGRKKQEVNEVEKQGTAMTQH